MHKTIAQLIEFHSAISRDSTNDNQTYYVKKDEPTTSQDSRNSNPVYCENAEAKFILQMFDIGHREEEELPRVNNISSLIFFLLNTVKNKNILGKQTHLQLPQLS